MLVAMAQYQAQVLDIRRFEIVEDSRLGVFEVLHLCKVIVEVSLANHAKPFLIVPQAAAVQIIRARIPRQALAVLDNPKFPQVAQKLPEDVCIRIERSVPLDTSKDDELLKLLSSMEAMLRRYDGFASLFAQRRASEEQRISSEEEHVSPQKRSGPDHGLDTSPDRGRLRTRR